MKGRRKHAAEKWQGGDLLQSIERAVCGRFAGMNHFGFIGRIVRLKNATETKARIERAEAICALMKHIEEEVVGKERWAELGLIQQMFEAAQKWSADGGVSDRLRFSLIQSNMILQALAERFGRKDIQKAELLAFWRRQHDDFLDVEDEQAYRCMREMDLPKAVPVALRRLTQRDFEALWDLYAEPLERIRSLISRVRRIRGRARLEKLADDRLSVSELKKFTDPQMTAERFFWEVLLTKKS